MFWVVLIKSVMKAQVLLKSDKTDERSLYMVKVREELVETWTGPEGSRMLRLPDFKTVGT
jgi:hypothetical protein